MVLSIIVAASENNVIGRDNSLIWRLSADLKRFKQLTTGHTIIMGRKTFESIGRALPNRRNIVVSRNRSYIAEGAEIATSLEEAQRLVEGEEQVFVIGGGTIYREMWDNAEKLYLTLVHTSVEGDTCIPEITSCWEEIARTNFQADEKNEFNYSFVDYCRR